MSYVIIPSDQENCYATCDQCGYQWVFAQRYLYRPAYRHDLCKSCTAEPVAQIWRNGERCVPWHGDFDEEDHPMQNGELYRPGERTCGARDCVNTKHIKSETTA